MTSTLLTVDTQRPVVAPSGELGRRQPVYMAVPTPNTYRDVAQRLPADSAWLSRSLALWVETNAEWVGDDHAKLRTSVHHDGGGRLIAEGRDCLALHGILQYPLWRDAIGQINGAREGSALWDALSQHVAELHHQVRRLLGVHKHEKLPSSKGFFVAEEMEDFEAVVLDGAGDGLNINGVGLREPFCSLGYDLTAPAGPHYPAAGWMPLGFNDHVETPSGHSRSRAKVDHSNSLNDTPLVQSSNHVRAL